MKKTDHSWASWSPTGRFAIATLALAMLAPIAQAQETRNWKSADGMETIQASLVDYDSKTKLVTLQAFQGAPIELKISRLSSADRRYIKNYLKANKPASLAKTTDKATAKASDQAGRSAISAKKRNPRSRNNYSLEMYGINWVPEMETAMKLAKGSESPKDDQPIMYFRVLGDLKGLM